MNNLIAANWKMNKTVKEAVDFFNEFNGKIDELVKDGFFSGDNDGNEILICPSFISLSEISKIKNEKIKLGAQNMYCEDSGAFTGEISPIMLKELCEYVILGHSERRHIFKEPNQLINKKVISAFNHGFNPILCIGETEEERKKKKTNDVLLTQLKACLKNVSENQVKALVIAYEPVWAIGTGKTATPEQAEEVHAFIREQLTDMYSQTTAMQLRILYGGSVKPNNASELIKQKNINGFLVGGAGLDPTQFIEIIVCKKSPF
ncbi:MAG: triose-phosphate isomerase [Candidatus Woesearchaeota archaeon]